MSLLATQSASHTEVVIALLLASIALLVTGARLLRVPYPVFLVIGGLGMGLIPGLPDVELEPDLVLLIFLPPLIYQSAFFFSLRDLRANLRPIGLLAIGLVVATTLVVGVVAHALIAGIPWAAAFTLGAIVSPTDPVAATSVASRIGLPHRVKVVVEGESLVNDATGLVAYKVAVAAVLSGSFSLLDATGTFVVGALGGIAIGLAVGWAVAFVRARIEDPPVEITISLLTAYAAFLPADELGLSGVIATVTVGLYLGLRAPRLQSPTTRIRAAAVWEVLVFLLNGLLFVLIGLQLGPIASGLDDISLIEAIGIGAACAFTVMATRYLWTFVFAFLPYRLWRPLREREEPPTARNVAVIAWMGMRGAVSLAAALAIPLTTDSGAPFPERDLILFVVFCVILATLVIQGLSLPAYCRALGVHRDRDDIIGLWQEHHARLTASIAALHRLDEIERQDWANPDSIGRMRAIFDYRRGRFIALVDGDADGPDYEQRAVQWVRLVAETIGAQRAAVVAMWESGEISLEVMRRIERDLDLEAARLGE